MAVLSPQQLQQLCGAPSLDGQQMRSILDSAFLPAPVPLLRFLSPTQQTSALARDFSVDMTDALTSAFASGVPIFDDVGLGLRHDGQIVLPPTTPVYFRAAGRNTEFRAGQTIAGAQIYKIGRSGGG